ncbi:hypothetical protein IMSAGC004_03311 [Bacteroidaceae bacterium]|nr:hypothetical protein IMSAGC004_03311 [Bacteroidaceae bacterium]
MISGTWYTEIDLDGNATGKDSIVLKQYGHKVIGKSYFSIVGENGEIDTKVYEVCGVVKNDFFCAYWIDSSRRQKGIGAFTYRIEEDGRVLNGHGTYYDEIDNQLKHGDYKLFLNDFSTRHRQGKVWSDY